MTPGMKRLLGYIRKADEDCQMIDSGDRIAVGLSGGKDSTALLLALAEYRRFSAHPFDIVGITVKEGFDAVTGSGRESETLVALEALCARIGVAYHVEATDIAAVVFEARAEKNPCSLCSRMRRGALNEAARKLGCNKVALGHHMDDAVETLFMNLFFEGRIGGFPPVMPMEQAGITQIRPLIYVPEKDVRYFISHADIPELDMGCPVNRSTQREEIKTMLRKLERQHKGLKHRVFLAMRNAALDGLPPEKAEEGAPDDD